MIYRPDPLKGIEVYIDADFAGGWDPADPMNAESIHSRTGYVIQYAGCPVYWQSKLQTKIALSTAEAEYMALFQALCETLPTSNLMKEINVIFPLYLPSPKFIIKVSKQSKVLSAYKTHCNQLSSFLYACYYTFESRWLHPD
jgi:hypothetical protein